MKPVPSPAILSTARPGKEQQPTWPNGQQAKTLTHMCLYQAVVPQGAWMLDITAAVRRRSVQLGPLVLALLNSSVVLTAGEE